MVMVGCQSRKDALMKKGNVLIEQIESFKKTNGILPNSLKDLKIEEKLEGPLYYEKKDSISYIVWFGLELGESIKYNSIQKKWE